MERSVRSVYDRASELQIKKYMPIKEGVGKGYVNLIHQDNIVRNVRMQCVTDLTEAVEDWYREIKPAIKRGETVTLQIQLDKIA